MPDYKTIYMTGQQGGFFKFVTNTPSNMTSGQLYAAKILIREPKTVEAGSVSIQDPRNAVFDLYWVLLADMNESQSLNAKFSDIFQVEEPNEQECSKLNFVQTKGNIRKRISKQLRFVELHLLNNIAASICMHS